MANEAYFSYYKAQTGGSLSDIKKVFYSANSGVQSGYGLEGMINFYNPKTLQQGYGFGSVFSSIYKFFRPLFSSGITAIKDQLFKTSTDAIKDLREKKPIKQILRQRGNEIVEGLTKKFQRKFTQEGDGVILRENKAFKKKKFHLNLQSKLKSSLKRTNSTKKNKKNKNKNKKGNKSKSKKLKTRVLDIFSNK